MRPKAPKRISLATLFGMLVIVVTATLYLATAQRDPAFWDTGEMQVVPWILGIAHPTGFPAFVLGAYAFSHVVAIGSVAWRISTFSALAAVAATFILYRAALRLTGNAAIAFGASLLFATGDIVWVHATRAEVHALSLAFTSGALLFALRFRDGEGDANLRYAGLSYGLALATHPVALWAAPGLLLVAMTRRRRAAGAPPSTRLALGLQVCACIVLAATLPYAYLPLRSAALYAARRDPTLSLGFPPGMPFWDYAHTAVLTNFWWLVTGQQFDKADGLAVYVRPVDWIAEIARFVSVAGREFTPLGVVFALTGAAALLARRLPLGIGMLAFGFFGVPFALAYSLEADKDRYLLLALWTTALLAACGAAAALSALRHLLHPRRSIAGAVPLAIRLRRICCVRPSADQCAIRLQRTSVVCRTKSDRRRARTGCGVGEVDAARVASVGLAAVLVALAGWDAWKARGTVAIDRDLTARRFITATERISTPDAIIVAPWIYATPLAYAAYVEHSFGRRIVVTAEAAALRGRMAAWSAQRCVVAVSDRRTLRLRGLRVSFPLEKHAPFLFRITTGNDRCAGARPHLTLSFRGER